MLKIPVSSFTGVFAMKSFGNMIKLLTLAFAGMFLLNVMIMHVFFDTDVFNPVKMDDAEINAAENKLESGNSSDFHRETDSTNPQYASAAQDEKYWEDPDDSIVPADSSKDTTDEADEAAATYYMTTSEVGFLGNLSMRDKLEALGLISKVGGEEADKIYDMALDGITYSEMKDIETMLKKHLDQKEMETLTSLLDKNKEKYSGSTLPPQ